MMHLFIEWFVVFAPSNSLITNTHAFCNYQLSVYSIYDMCVERNCKPPQSLNNTLEIPIIMINQLGYYHYSRELVIVIIFCGYKFVDGDLCVFYMLVGQLR